MLVAHLHQRDLQVMEIIATTIIGQWPGTVIQKVASAQGVFDILVHALWIDTHHEVDAFASPDVPVSVDPNFVPGGQALDIGWENILGRNWNTHPEDGLGKKHIGTGRAGTIDVGKPDHKIIYTTTDGHT